MDPLMAAGACGLWLVACRAMFSVVHVGNGGHCVVTSLADGQRATVRTNRRAAMRRLTTHRRYVYVQMTGSHCHPEQHVPRSSHAQLRPRPLCLVCSSGEVSSERHRCARAQAGHGPGRAEGQQQGPGRVKVRRCGAVRRCRCSGLG
jgi:hypothetical protein